MALTVGGLFSGIGGWELGLERAGMRVLWHCEADPFARRVLREHWPEVPCYEDLRELRGADVEPVDVLCGGFPCQPVSRTGLRAAQADERWLWPEFARLVDELRPRYVLVENVPGLLDGGLGDVLRDLAACGFDAEWDCLPAGAFGAHHGRDRVWLVAYAVLEPGAIRRASVQPRGLPRALVAGARAPSAVGRPPAPDVPVLVHGVPHSVAACGALGNALDPRIAELIGTRILEREGCVAA